MTRLTLPIDAVLPQIIDALSKQSALVITAPTGSGKTTRVPPALFESGLAGNGMIVMLEPRRLATRAAARRMAAEGGFRLGEEVGYQVRFDRQWGPKTRILVVTEGLLVRMLQDDPYLEKVNVVVFDEFHERSLDTDLALGMVRLVQQSVRPELRVVVMSATLAAESIAEYLGGCPIVTSQGRQFPLDIVYEPRLGNTSVPSAAAQAAQELFNRTSGDLLVFLPGMREIRHTADHLQEWADSQGVMVLPLHGDLTAERQDRALLPQERRKIVLATNVAETSVTVEGITGVVDSGQARILGFDAKAGLDRLQLKVISRASADQRAGRAARTQPGICVRLWSEASHRQRPEHIEPEIRRVDLAGPVLQLLAWGEHQLDQFPWFEPPAAEQVARALALLRRLGAVSANGLTDLGTLLAGLPLHPRLGCLLIEGVRRSQLARAALAAAVLAERDPFSRKDNQEERRETVSDVLDRIEALEEFARGAAPTGLNRGAARLVLHAARQYQRLAEKLTKEIDTCVPTDPDESVLRALLTAFPDRLCRRREPGSRKGVMVGGRGVRLAPGSGVLQPELFVAVEIDAGPSEALVWQASAIERDWLPTEDIESATVVSFDLESGKVFARKQTRYADLVLQEKEAALPDDAQVAEVLLRAARQHWERVAPAADSLPGMYLIRLRCLREWLPELGIPAFDDAQLQELLADLCPGCRSFDDLRRAPWIPVLQSRLTPVQRQAIEREAPEYLTVPSGSRLPLHYDEGRPPVLKVRIQEIFGWKETPRLAGGRVRVLLHLLAPSNRPQQVTDDLASFWANTYVRIRKELRARYPKHAWPEDPTTALPERRPGKRR